MKFYAIALSLLFATARLGFSQGVIQDSNVKSEIPKLHRGSLELQTDIELYPNPTNQFLNINLENSNLKDVQFEMYNIIGNKLDIRPEPVSKNNFKINVKNLHAGYYFLIVKDRVTRFNKAYKFQKI